MKSMFFLLVQREYLALTVTSAAMTCFMEIVDRAYPADGLRPEIRNTGRVGASDNK